MAVKPKDVIRVAEFRNRLVVFVNYVGENVRRNESTPQDVQSRIGEEQAWLGQEYGSVYRVIVPYGIPQMQQFGAIVSSDAVRDAIGRLDQPSYPALAQMAIQHLDMVIGRMRADVEERRLAPGSSDTIYRLTSPVYWGGRLVAALRRLLSTNRGRITAVISVLVVAVIGGIVSGVAQAWFEALLSASAHP